MGIRRGPSIVTDNLTFAVDAANPDSYISGSTVWKDQTVNQNNGAINNGPTFDSSDGGSIVFDGTDDNVLTTDTLTTAVGSYNLWVKPDLTNDRWVISSDANTYRTFVGIRTLSDGKVRAQSNVSGTEKWKLETDSAVLNSSNWTHITLTHNTTEAKLYIDGVAVAQTFISSADKTVWWNDFSPIRTRLGGWVISGYSSLYWNGNISNTQIYNKELSAAEVLQNYNALKNRFV